MEPRDPCFTMAQLRKITRYDDWTLERLLKNIPYRMSYNASKDNRVKCYESKQVYSEIINNQIQTESVIKYFDPKKTKGEKD